VWLIMIFWVLGAKFVMGDNVWCKGGIEAYCCGGDGVWCLGIVGDGSVARGDECC
jgi:hypothetical protein